MQRDETTVVELDFVGGRIAFDGGDPSAGIFRTARRDGNA
jgi:hypothetical protein